MSERVAGSGASAPETPPSAAPPTLKHCWVVDHQGRAPALLLGWRRADAGFFGRVVRPVQDPELGWIVVEEWMPAALLEPAQVSAPAVIRRGEGRA